MKIGKIFNNRYIRIDVSKNAKLPYYLRNIFTFLMPSGFYQKRLTNILNHSQDKAYINNRVDYYNKVDKPFTLTEAKSIKIFKRFSFSKDSQT